MKIWLAQNTHFPPYPFWYKYYIIIYTDILFINLLRDYGYYIKWNVLVEIGKFHFCTIWQSHIFWLLHDKYCQKEIWKHIKGLRERIWESHTTIHVGLFSWLYVGTPIVTYVDSSKVDLSNKLPKIMVFYVPKIKQKLKWIFLEILC